ncbi:uncharacterized protein LOC141634040 isoform X2 [Silene latifolia]|uniref:uncharacterized protein LOC141634040 isoform X2 n=1 Tax=Silene latifolia TaxID=37657 RepID=UPI003D77F420
MALDGVPRKRGADKNVELFFHSDNPTGWNDSSGLGRIHDHEEDHLHHSKKLSILARVKDSAKKWRHFIARKRHGRDANHTPSWGVALEDYEVDDDTEPHGNPMHQPHHAGKSSKDNERHNPVSNPIMFHDKHNTSNITNLHPGNLDPISPRRKTNVGRPLVKSHCNHEAGTSSISKLTVDETRQVKSFRNLDREKVPSPSPSEIISEALIMKKSDDKQKDKLLFSEMTVEPVLLGPKISGDKVGHSSDSKTAVDNKERDSSPHSLRKADQETEKPAHSPKKTPLTEGGQTNELRKKIKGGFCKLTERLELSLISTIMSDNLWMFQGRSSKAQVLFDAVSSQIPSRLDGMVTIFPKCVFTLFIKWSINSSE